MKLRILLALLCLTALLGGCAAPSVATRAAKATTQPVGVTTFSDPATEPVTEPSIEPDTLNVLRESLSEVHTVSIDLLYMQLADNGFSQSIRQETALDGSFHFITTKRIWDHRTGQDTQTVAEFYYLNEAGQFVCYQKIDGGATDRAVLSSADKIALGVSAEQFAGARAFFPSYLEQFSDSGISEETGQQCYTFRLPVEKVLADSEGLLLRNYLASALSLGNTAQDADLSGVAVLCTVYTSAQTGRIERLSMDFSELKPFVLSNGAQSGEFALDMESMSLEYLLGYETAETTELPEAFLAETPAE